MRVLVTGGHGFIGRYVVRGLCLAGHDVLVLDKQAAPPELQEHVHAYRFVQGDIFDPALVQRVAEERIEAVIHLVALADYHACQQDPRLSFHLNVEALHTALELCRGARLRRLLFPSSAAVYGRTDRIPIAEDTPTRASGIYGYHKLMGELLVHAYHANFNLDYTILRLFNVFGKGDRGIIGRSVLAAINGDELPVFRLDQLRDFVYAGDVAASFERALRTPAARNETVNIGSGQGLTIEQTVTMVRKLLPSLKTVLSERTDYVPYDSVADNRRAQALLGVRFGAGLEFVRRIVQKELLAG